MASRDDEPLPSVAGWLQSARATHLRGRALTDAVRAAYHAADRDSTMPPSDELHPYRVFVGYRLVRALARARGLLEPEDRLLELDIDTDDYGGGDIWTTAHPGWTRPRQAPCKELAEVLGRRMGVSLLPPPRHREDLLNWCEAMSILAVRLRVTGSEAGKYGLDGVLQPNIVQRIFPSREELLAFEEFFIEDLLQLVVEVSEQKALAHLRKEYAIQRHEGLELLTVARCEAARVNDIPVEEARAIMAMRLTHLYEQSRQADDLRTMRNSLKDLAVVQGVNRAETKDAIADFLEAARAVHAARAEETLPPVPERPALAEPQDADYRVVNDHTLPTEPD